MKSKLELRLETNRNDVLKECLTDLIDGLDISIESNAIVVKLEEEGRLIKNAHILVTYTNYILKTINQLEQFNN
ncbi:uncharacterized protein NEPG_00331 [Nematocida parisii ERTm1]|uniref:Uncharacterized protein n=1 Tax=Nematocida parisii (strain ERTm3) TaxID=935791 RepID=I3EH60_NEMP3|nr:uncharacterized protein NEPG_00331 [Nematocida parisii ERTm1]EIJ88557.1 hypothetical protein NEQG_01247 [Nematocida parisii ERTm3]EIJ94807.1 hypothetical protein NEPG_00331 [Nematocida parisii ERTm1]KAI5145308.1 hypothetical protein NEPAR07_1591 [Nematocida parisii]|eukprot:XP_013058163.1 hypothetical protein NEPG_00331 [Nematocida parisii ERTm1]